MSNLQNEENTVYTSTPIKPTAPLLVDKLDDMSVILKGYEIETIGNQAVRKVQQESREKCIPLVLSVDGQIYYELADGTILKKHGNVSLLDSMILEVNEQKPGFLDPLYKK